MSHLDMMDEDEELAFVAESHAPMIGTPTTDVMDTGDFDAQQPKIPARSTLRVNTQNSLRPPPPATVTSGSRISPTSTSDSEGDGAQNGKVLSLPSFHLPNRTRASYCRDRGPETPPLTSPSHSSLNSNSAISQISALHTPPHSPWAHSFALTDITTPCSHLSAISEVNTSEDQEHRLSLPTTPAKTPQTLQPFAKVQRLSPSPSPPVQSEEPVMITAHSLPHRHDTHHVYLSDTHSPTETVTNVNVLLNATTSPASLTDFSTPTTTAMAMLCPPSTPSSPSHSTFSTGSSGAGSTGVVGWPFASKSKTIIAAPPTKAQKAQEKKRKKEEARARKERLALELRRRTEAQRAKADNASAYTVRSAEKKRTWEEDTAMFGGLMM
jgi:hypothetical protein